MMKERLRCHHVIILSLHHIIMSSCHHVIMSSWHHVITSSIYLHIWWYLHLMDNLGKPAMFLMEMAVCRLTSHIQLAGCLIHLYGIWNMDMEYIKDGYWCGYPGYGLIFFEHFLDRVTFKQWLQAGWFSSCVAHLILIECISQEVQLVGKVWKQKILNLTRNSRSGAIVSSKSYNSKSTSLQAFSLCKKKIRWI